MQQLLAANPAIDQVDNDGITPLFVACPDGHSECVQLLLAANAPIDQAGNSGITPLFAACGSGHSECVQLLLAANATIDRRAGNIGVTPLLTACTNGHIKCVQLLLAANAAIGQADNDGHTPLHMACSSGHIECVQQLLAANAAIDQAADTGITSLHAAALQGRLDVVKLLVQAGARTDRTALGGTPLQLAERHGCTAVAGFLRTSRRRRRTAVAAPAFASAEDEAAAELAAELAAVALLAEAEQGPSKAKQKAEGKRSKSKAKRATTSAAAAASLAAPHIAERAAGSSAAEAPAVEDITEAGAESASDESRATDVARRTADEALRGAMATGEYERLAMTIEQQCAAASGEVLQEARAMRERLNKRRKKESQRLRRAHAAEMEAQQAGPQSLSVDDEATPAVSGGGGCAIALPLGELAEATGGFGDAKLIGSGGYGRVYIADALPSLPPASLPPQLRGLPVAVKKAKSGQHELSNLQREVSVLRQCSHPHLLPLLGYYLEREAPCLVFPLMRGGSFADRLWPSEADPEHLRRLSVSLAPLDWRARLRILRQATDALLYLHTPLADGKGIVIHRDFKPENILLDERLNAYLADTGFAKMERPDASSKRSVSNALYLTKGYLDPIIGEGGDYSPLTDGYALGITLLVTLTRRSPLKIIHACEEAFEMDFADIPSEQLADAAVGWPPHASAALKELVLCASAKCLCARSQRKRLPLSEVLATLTGLMSEGEGGAGACANPVEGPSASMAVGEAAAASAAAYEPTPLSVQVRGLRKGGDAQESTKANMLLAFSAMIERLDRVYVAKAAQAPKGFEARIGYWHRECGMSASLADGMHTLRIWSNAARHQDSERWRRDGPRDEAEASRRVAAIERAVKALEPSEPSRSR